VPGGPATGGTEGWYDCDNLRNDSPNNSGLIEFPHSTGTGMDAGKVRGNNLWWSRGNPSSSNGCPEFPRQRTAPAGRLGAPNYGVTPTQGCPYVNDQGLTVMNGPLYRYESGADNSRRWPQYWDGRWFLHNNGGASVKHGLLLDPATDQDAGLPVYADSLRNALSWQGSYMDSKFGPDGALYVQTYDGFFRAGPNVSIYRYDYVGGAPTPGANPRAFAIGNRGVRFSSAGSGGVEWEWDFGDSTAKSNEANPTHTYAEAKRYTATLTVTYADGAKDSKTVDIDVLSQADETAPVTTPQLTPAQPGSGGTYQRAVTLTLTATDGTGGSGVDITEYRVNGGDWIEYEAPIRREQPGMYLIEFRSTDRTGNVEATKSVTFTIAVADNCLTDFNDEFNGDALDPKWQVLRPLPDARSFVDGALRIKVRDGDMIGTDADARNVLLQDAPSGSWQIQTKLDVSTLTNSGEQAGFVLWQSEGPNTFAKITYISKDTFSQYEWVATRNNTSQISAGPQISTPDGDVWLRVSHNGSGTYIAEGSVNGEDWIKIAGDITDLGNPETLKFGLKVSDTADSENYAGFDWFRVDCSDRVPPTTTAEIPDIDGELGWYQTAPEITLTADDGELGEVAKVEYRIDGSGDDPWTTYTEPFTVTDPGAHVVEYRATDAAENVETTKRLAFRVDGSAPVPEATVEGDLDNGPVEVTLDTSDGDAGSGTVLTEYRVDGGPWEVYEAVDDEVLFDGSEASLQQWRQAPTGRFDLLSDATGPYITPVGGLGMLWYPAKQYGDFKFKFQFREGRTDGGFSNGGAFVRFPNPDETPRVHECSKVGSAATSSAWVAINCGHEIQLYDGETGETRKTGSIYTFDNTTLDQAGIDPSKRGTWEDYEIEVVGQHYTIRRNGEVLNEFDNTPGKNSDRAGDPSTTLRQFTEGYIGLQNHGGADTMQYRAMRVEDLTPGAPKAADGTGPFDVEGRGPHTIEVRTVDAAGNEGSETFDLEIGSIEAPPVDPDDGDDGGDNTPPTVVALPPVATLPPMIDTPASFRLGTFTSRIKRATFARRGLSVPVACTGAMDGSAKLTVSSAMRKRLKLKSRTLDRTDLRCWGQQTARVSLKPSSSIARLLARKGGPASVKMTVSVQMRDWGKPATTLTKSVTLKRR
jgi:PKD repeat protein